ncbi:MAG: hypothetical protein C4562_04415 [Actinobacteria bacterium]|nr:MAG: hypothetical protein C4562_04415 [Actinomycetota bacterium]
MLKIAVYAAYPKESAGFLRMLNSKPLKGVYLDSNLNKNPDLIVNIGFVGSLTSDNWGRLFLVEKFIDSVSREEIVLNNSCLANMAAVKDIKKAPVVTVNSEVSDKKVAKKIFEDTKCNLVDMEGFSLAKQAEEENIPLVSIKMVSDYCDGGALDMIKAKGFELSAKLGAATYRLLSEIGQKL